MANILGVSVGTRNVGLAVMRLRILTDYRIRTFPGKWTPQKRKRILEIVESLVIMNGITDMTLKIPGVHHCSLGIHDLVSGIAEIAETHKIRLHRCTTADLKLCYTDAKRSNKAVMVDALVKKYPVLRERQAGSKKAQAYHAKLFEAIACAELALKAGH